MTETQKYHLEFIQKWGYNSLFNNTIQKLDNLYNANEIDEDEYYIQLKEWIHNSISSPCVLNISCEIITKDFFVDLIQDILSDFPIECYVSAATSNRYKYFIDPIVQIRYWNNCVNHRNFEDTLFQKKYFTNIKKEIKGILTINRQTQKRNYLHSKIKKFDGYYNYSHITNKFLPWREHSELSKKSYVHFVVETDCYDIGLRGANLFENHFTEKTYLPILEESILVVLGGNNFNKSLSNLGIKTWNNDFGFNDSDSLNANNPSKIIDSYVDCIDYFNELSIDDIKNIYNKDKKEILKNKEILEEIIY